MPGGGFGGGLHSRRGCMDQSTGLNCSIVQDLKTIIFQLGFNFLPTPASYNPFQVIQSSVTKRYLDGKFDFWHAGENIENSTL